MGHEDYKELLALDAVGALEAEGRRTLDAHLPDCAECRAELRDMSDAAAGLAYAVAPVAPPAHLRARILESVRAQAPAESATPRAPSDIKGEARRLLRRLGLWDILRARPALGFGAATAFAAIAALAFTTALLWQRADRLGAEVARLSGRLNDTQGELAEQRGQLARQRELAEMLAAPGTRVAELNGKDVAPQAHAVVAVHSATGRAMLVAEGLPAAPAGKAYQLWFIAGGKPPMPGGVFKTDAAGRAMMKDRMPEGAAAANTFAVTLETEAGEQAPKGAMFLLSAAS